MVGLPAPRRPPLPPECSWSSEIAQVHTVVEHTIEEGILCDFLGDLRGDRPDPGDLAEFPISNVMPAPLCHVVTHEDDELGSFGSSFARATQQSGEGIGQVALEGLWRVVLSCGARLASGFSLGTSQDRRAHVRLQGEVDVDHAESSE
jgi:hypothetical protein